MTKGESRGLTITFMGGTKMSFGLPQQGANTAAKQLAQEDIETVRLPGHAIRNATLTRGDV